MFNYQEGEITLGPDESINLSFLTTNSNLESTTISLSIWPTHHNYAAKELMFFSKFLDKISSQHWITVCKISNGSCSTQPSLGKICLKTF